MPPPLPWLDPEDPFPDPADAWGPDAPVPGLLAAGGSLDVAHLRAAYTQGIFPWFSAGQPILWWAPHPRMVLPIAQFRLHKSLYKTIQKFRQDARCEIRIDHAFDRVISECATTHRTGQSGTWIVPAMQEAYCQWHQAGYVHSVETWVDGRLVGGLYYVAIGQAVFGESMFAHVPDASKIALAALVCMCRHHGAGWIDCQQNTRHLASLGAREIARADFLMHVRQACSHPDLPWIFQPLYWNELLASSICRA